MQICTRQFPSSNNLQSSSAHTSRTLMYRNIVSGLNNVLCIQRKNNVVELAPEEITISSPLGGSFSSHACVTQSYPLHRRLISLRMTSVRRKLAHPSISKSTSPPASVSFVLSQWMNSLCSANCKQKSTTYFATKMDLFRNNKELQYSTCRHGQPGARERAKRSRKLFSQSRKGS